MFRKSALILATASLVNPGSIALRAQDECEQCDLPPACRDGAPQTLTRSRARNCQALTLDIESDIDFGRVVVLKRGEGQIVLDLSTGEKRLVGDLDDLGGVPVTGRATITGAPFEALRVNLPSSVNMRDATGGQAEIRDFVSDLPALPTLDANGQLTFNFSGTLRLSAQTDASGKLRGRVPISVEYQ